MIAKELIINGRIYQYQQRFLKEDNLWECSFADNEGHYAEVDSGNLIAYDESLGKAKGELETAIIDSGLKIGTDNELVLWRKLDPEKQRKILLLAKKIKWDLIGEWDTDDSRFEKWRNIMNKRTGFVFTRAIFNRV